MCRPSLIGASFSLGRSVGSTGAASGGGGGGVESPTVKPPPCSVIGPAADRPRVWWGPDPATGVWIPEGEELQTHVPTRSAGPTVSAWFRDDVHAPIGE